MGSFHHEQESFGAGELAPSILGRIRSPPYATGLSAAENWLVRAQGSLLMRAGSMYVNSEASDFARFISFRSASQSEDFNIVITPGHVRVYTRGGRVTGFGNELVINGYFNAPGNWFLGWTNVNLQGWLQPVNSYPYGLVNLLNNPFAGVPGGVNGRVRQAIAVTPGSTYRLMFYAGAVHVRIGSAPGAVDYFEDPTSISYGVRNLTITTTGPVIYIDAENAGWTSYGGLFGQVSLREVAAVVDLAAPWTEQQLAAIQFVQEPAKDRMYLVHPNVAPQLLTFAAPATWALAPVGFVSPPADWVAGNYPSVVEWFQGRLLLGASPTSPTTVWGSKPNAPTDFTMGAATPADAYTHVVSTKGIIRWLRGHRALLLGDDVYEHSAVGSSYIITPSDIQVREESSFGSAPVQALHIGDQALFVTRDRIHVRALGYSLQDNGWISRALTFLAEHMSGPGFVELHFARSPQQRILALRSDGVIVGCTYERGEQVVAWWRASISGGTVRTMCVVDDPSGSWLALGISRTPGAVCIEYLPLHETGAVYVDGAVSGVVAADGTFAGLDHLEGRAVRVIVDGAIDATDGQTVVGGQVSGIDLALVGKSITVGLAYRPKGVQLPPEGGNPKGTAQLSRRRVVMGIVRVNDSAPPLVNGQRAGVIEGTDRSPSTPFDTGEPRYTGDLEFGEGDWDDDGVCTVEQDMPFRTEVLAIFKVVNVEDVH